MTERAAYSSQTYDGIAARLRDIYATYPMVMEAAAEIERLTKGLRMLAKQEYDAGYTPEDFAEAILSGDEPAAEALKP